MTVYLDLAKKQAVIKRKKINKVGEGFKFLMVFYVLSGIVIMLGLSYGLVVNKLATVGYGIKSSEKKIVEMKDKNDELRIKISEARSAKLLEAKIIEVGMTEPEDIDYMTIGKEFALKR